MWEDLVGSGRILVGSGRILGGCGRIFGGCGGIWGDVWRTFGGVLDGCSYTSAGCLGGFQRMLMGFLCERFSSSTFLFLDTCFSHLIIRYCIQTPFV